jgi:hypothetical protein
MSFEELSEREELIVFKEGNKTNNTLTLWLGDLVVHK